MVYKYLVLGGGRQGISATYDLGKFGEANEIILADIEISLAEKNAQIINDFLGNSIVKAAKLDVSNPEGLRNLLIDIHTVISCVPYNFNLQIMEATLRSKTNMCDLGGHTQTVLEQRKSDSEAKEIGISIVPDCGMGPGMNISLAVYAMSLLDEPEEIYIWDGGLPQNPQPPWNYALTFNIGGLTNEYFGDAYFLREGKITKVPCFEGYEQLDFPPPLNKLEAFVTSGGLSTMPWTMKGKLERLENKTLRYPGHADQFRSYSQLGLFEEEPLEIGGQKVIPRDVFHALIEPKIRQDYVKDIAVIRVKCVGKKNGDKAEAVVELIDRFDESTGFTAMQRLTGWHASIVAILSTKNRITKGVVPVESISGEMMVEEARRRGFEITEQIRNL
jgi:lysine 6-dehydrogenase